MGIMLPPKLSVVITLESDVTPQRLFRHFDDVAVADERVQLIVCGPRGAFSGGCGSAQVMRGGALWDPVMTPPCCRARLRNCGIAKAEAGAVLLLAGDFLPWPGALAAHIDFHRRHPGMLDIAVAAGVFPKADRSRFMRWLEDSGRLFGYRFPADGGSEQAIAFFYGANSSLKRSLLERVGPFDEGLPYASCDDQDMGFRLADLGARCWLLPAAGAWHEHHVTPVARAASLREAGWSLPRLQARHPQRRLIGPHMRRMRILEGSRRRGLWAALGRLAGVPSRASWFAKQADLVLASACFEATDSLRS